MAAYDDAITRNEGGEYRRDQGIYSSQITEWRKLRDAGVLEGKQPSEKIGRLSAEQAEIAKLRRQLSQAEQRLATALTPQNPGAGGRDDEGNLSASLAIPAPFTQTGARR